MEIILRYAKGIILILGFVAATLQQEFAIGLPLWLTGAITSLTAILVPNGK